MSAAANSKYFLQSLFKEIFKSVLREEGVLAGPEAVSRHYDKIGIKISTYS